MGTRLCREALASGHVFQLNSPASSHSLLTSETLSRVTKEGPSHWRWEEDGSGGMVAFLYMWVLDELGFVGTGNSVSSKCSNLGGEEAGVWEEASSTRVLTGLVGQGRGA